MTVIGSHSKWKPVDNLFASWTKKLIREALNPYKPWWWIAVTLAIVGMIWLIISYFPILWPDKYKESRIETPISPELSVLHAPRMVVGQSYPIKFIHTLQVVPNDYPMTISYIVMTDWTSGGSFDEPELTFTHQNMAPKPMERYLLLELAQPPSDQIIIEIKDPRNNLVGQIPIPLIKIPDLISWILLPFAVTVTTIGRGLCLLLKILWKKITQ